MNVIIARAFSPTPTTFSDRTKGSPGGNQLPNCYEAGSYIYFLVLNWNAVLKTLHACLLIIHVVNCKLGIKIYSE